MWGVSQVADSLLEQALTLLLKSRDARVGDLASLDAEQLDEEEVDRLWSAETERRAAELESGDADS